METIDVMLWLVLGLAYAGSAVALHRLFNRFIEPFKHHAGHQARSAAEQT